MNTQQWLGTKGLVARSFGNGVGIFNIETDEKIAFLTGEELSLNHTPAMTRDLISQKLGL